MKNRFSFASVTTWVVPVTAVLFISGCASLERTSKYTDMQSIALCQVDKKARAAEKKITAEYGFKRFAENTYRPVLDHSLFGHEIRVIELGEKGNKLYVAGNPKEFGHHFGWIMNDVKCENNSCQAPIGKDQTLHIYKARNKKAKDTVVVECTKPTLANEQ